MRFSNTLLLALISIASSFAFSPTPTSTSHCHTTSTCSRHSLSLSSTVRNDNNTKQPTTTTTTRLQFLQKAFLTTAAATTIATTSLPNDALATATAATAASPEKQYNLSSESIAQIVYDDLVLNSFLTNGKLTRSIYDEKATFTDEIDTYTLPQWIKGTARLFVPPPPSSTSSSVSSSTASSTTASTGNKRGGSRVGIVGEVVATDKTVEFNFEEDLMFNIPFNPVVFVSGKVILERDLDSGLITSYREFWDQDVSTVLKSARFK